MKTITYNGDASQVLGRMELPPELESAIRTDAAVLLVGCTYDAVTGEVLSYDLVPMPVVATHG